jgi:hypothetical protein
VQWLALINEGKHPRDEFVAFTIRELVQLGRATEMCGIERVASWASQGALFCDFD